MKADDLRISVDSGNLSDGSKVYTVRVHQGTRYIEFDAISEDAAHRLALVLEATVLSHTVNAIVA